MGVGRMVRKTAVHVTRRAKVVRIVFGQVTFRGGMC